MNLALRLPTLRDAFAVLFARRGTVLVTPPLTVSALLDDVRRYREVNEVAQRTHATGEHSSLGIFAYRVFCELMRTDGKVDLTKPVPTDADWRMVKEACSRVRGEPWVVGAGRPL